MSSFSLSFVKLNVIYWEFISGKLDSMRHLKNEVDTIKKGTECGLQLADKSIEVEADDMVICYTTKKVKQTIEWNPGF